MTTTTWVQSHLQTGTLSALRHRNFRMYFVGQLISLSGTWMQGVAQGWLVFHLTQSEVWLGVVACAAGLPSLLLSPFAGVLVERIPRRRILLFTQTSQMFLALILSLLTFAQVVQVWHVVTLAFLLGVVNSVDAPARQTFISDMVGRAELSSGITLNSMVINGARVVGPAVAGITLAKVGPAWCFFINAMSFLAVIMMLWFMDVQLKPKQLSQTSPLAQLKEGIRFARRHPTIGPLLLLAVTAALFSFNIGSVLPAFADTVLHSPIDAYAGMNTAQGIGAVCAGLLVATLGQRFGRGRVVTAMTIWVALAVLFVSQSRLVPFAIVMMGMVGFGVILQFITVNTMIQSEVPDEFRGRVLSLYTLTFFGVSPFGALALGFTARLIGVADAVACYALIGGLISIVIMLRSTQARQLQ